jgi:hypothetical protein
VAEQQLARFAAAVLDGDEERRALLEIARVVAGAGF